MPDDTPDIDYLNFEIRSENPGIRNLQALVQKLPPRPPSSLGHPTIIVLGETSEDTGPPRRILTDNRIKSLDLAHGDSLFLAHSITLAAIQTWRPS